MYATQQLRDEHDGILVMLSVLEQLARELQHGREVNRTHLEQALDFLRTFADRCHHGKEEDLLFPALREAGLPSEGGPIGVMLHEHTEGRAHIRGMADALARLQAGADGADTFARHALGYVALLRAHIDKENNVLFALAERLLPPEAHTRLAADFDRVESERIGPGVHERYHALIRQLRDTYLRPAA